MIGDKKLKYFTLILIFSMLFIFSVNSSYAQESKIGLPGPEHVKAVQEDIKEASESLFEKIKNTISKTNKFVHFFKNTSQKIGSWWYLKTKPWIELQWNNFNNYMEKEIRLE